MLPSCPPFSSLISGPQRIVARRTVPQNGVLGNVSALLSLLSMLGREEVVANPRDVEGCGSKGLKVGP